MKLRCLAHCLVLALFVTASLLAAFISPAGAGHGLTDAVEMTLPGHADIPCCPSDQGKAQDCGTSCPALNACQATCSAGFPVAFAALLQPVRAEPGPIGDEAIRASRPAEPPARPPRS